MVTDKWQAGLCNKAGECPSRVKVGSVYSPRAARYAGGWGDLLVGADLALVRTTKVIARTGHCCLCNP